jgi:tRNA-specific 2-thiouridylase
MKDEVRRIALEERLVNANRKDSQGICFLGKINYNEYLRRYLGEQPGDVVEQDTGRIIGHHRGLWFHTIGQRKGLGFGEGPWFVVKKDVERNILYVSHGYDPQTAYKSRFGVRDFHFLTEGVSQLPERVTFKIRHTPEFAQGHLSKTAEGYRIVSDTRIQGIAAGQYATIYDNDAHLVVAAGQIAN